MNDKLNELSAEFYEKAEQIERKLEQIRSEVADAERVAHTRGFKEGLDAQAFDFTGKTIVVKVPEDKIDETASNLSRAGAMFNCKFVILSDFVELKDLHDLELKSIGLKKDV